VQDFAGVAQGSFTGPDHEYPSYLELRLTAADSGGLTDTHSIRLDPKTVELNFETQPSGLNLTVGGATSTAPFTRRVIQGSVNTISAPTPQTLASATYDFSAWSDGGARTHSITADAPGRPSGHLHPAPAVTPRAGLDPGPPGAAIIRRLLLGR
jgi:hypothetical protein